MRVLVIVKSTPEIEAKEMPEAEMTQMFEEMGKYNEELVNAGLMLSAEGLLPSTNGARVLFSGADRSVVDGPFTEAKELVAGFWIWKVDSMEQAIDWALHPARRFARHRRGQADRRRTAMRVMVMVKLTPGLEAAVQPTEELFAAMGKYNEELVNAGIMLSGEGLVPTEKAKIVHFKGDDRSVIDGPFAEAKEFIGGFWIWKVDSMDQAIEWAKRCPNPMGLESDLELRPIAEMGDMPAEFTPELQEQEARLRDQIEKNQQ